MPKAPDARLDWVEEWVVNELEQQWVGRVGLGRPHTVDGGHECAAFVGGRLSDPVLVRADTALDALVGATEILKLLRDDIGATIEARAGTVSSEPIGQLMRGEVNVSIGPPEREIGPRGCQCPVTVDGVRRVVVGASPLEALCTALDVVEHYFRRPPTVAWRHAARIAGK